MILLNETEVRIVGSLIEKSISTPEYYPLSLNSLTNACNQKSSRDPVLSLNEIEVEKNITSLREKKFVRLIADGSRVAKYKESFTEELKLSEPEIAVICVLMLRGSQTIGEIRTRTVRLYDFKSLEEVENILNILQTREYPLVVKLDRQTGMKERRFSHLLCGQPVIAELPQSEKLGNDDRLNNLQDEVEYLKSEINDLKIQFEQFKKQFE